MKHRCRQIPITPRTPRRRPPDHLPDGNWQPGRHRRISDLDVDSAGIRESARALMLAAKGETKQALSALDQALQENPNDATANLTYGRIMAEIGSKEKAIEALTNLQDNDQCSHSQPETVRGHRKTGHDRGRIRNSRQRLSRKSINSKIWNRSFRLNLPK